MSKITYYPLGNADSYLIELPEKYILCDFADERDPDNKYDTKIDLPEAVKTDIGWPHRKNIDVVAFSHIDDDHVKGSPDFFYLDYAAEYQGEDRVKIDELWVPAAAIVEKGTDGAALRIRQEARHRLRKGYGIRVFGRPEHLKEWFDNEEDVNLEDRKHLIFDAGDTVMSIEEDGVEFFIHAPFAERDGDVLLDRNDNSLVMQATFDGGTQVFCTDDITHEVWSKIVSITESHGRPEKLQWDLMKGSHHCSYKALSADKGKNETAPVPEVQRLLEYAKEKATIVLTCDPIQDIDQKQPPHFQASNCYKSYVSKVDGRVLVTMEHPKKTAPERMVFEITAAGVRLEERSKVTASTVYSAPAPRVG